MACLISFTSHGLTKLQRSQAEASVWAGLQHQNILPLLGVTYRLNSREIYGMVCPWVGCNLSEYLREKQSSLSLANRLKIVRVSRYSSKFI